MTALEQIGEALDAGNIVSFQVTPDEPHITIPTDDGNVHVIPRSVFEEIGQGDMDIARIEDFQPIIRKVVREWLRYLDIKKMVEEDA